jgi:predicted ATP-dependent endonuclease of OLD family
MDEPGLTLHAKAQEDLLRYINEKLKPSHQVIYSTHSPFMVDSGRLSAARTVEDVITTTGEVQGTKVGDQVLSTDPDTLFPLQAALGYDITQTLFVGKHTLLVEGPSDLLYLTWFSNELKSRGRLHLDRRWVITPAGGIDKVGSFVTLFRGQHLHIAALVDYHTGDKKKVRDLRDSELLLQGHVLSADVYAGQAEADTEDIIGRPLYTALVNQGYSLPADHKLSEQKADNAPLRVLEEVEAHFRLLPSQIPEFSHFQPASYLIECGAELRQSLPALDETLARFERLFSDLNGLLPT